MNSEEYLLPLIRLLAEGNGQRAIASELNERGLLQPNGCRWSQPAISKFMQAHGITPFFTLKVYPEYEKTKNYA